jgi:hypothetical protein
MAIANPSQAETKKLMLWRMWLVLFVVLLVPQSLAMAIMMQIAACVSCVVMAIACMAMLIGGKATVWFVIAMPAVSSASACLFYDRYLESWYVFAFHEVCILCLAWAGHVQGYINLGRPEKDRVRRPKPEEGRE